MKRPRRTWQAVLVGSLFVLSSCAGTSDRRDPSPSDIDISVVTEAPGGLTGVVDQVDRAREVGADLEQRNTSLEDALP